MESLMPIHDEADFRLGLLTPPPPAMVRQPDIEHTAPDPIYDTYQRILPMAGDPEMDSYVDSFVSYQREMMHPSLQGQHRQQMYARPAPQQSATQTTPQQQQQHCSTQEFQNYAEMKQQIAADQNQNYSAPAQQAQPHINERPSDHGNMTLTDMNSLDPSTNPMYFDPSPQGATFVHNEMKSPAPAQAAAVAQQYSYSPAAMQSSMHMENSIVNSMQQSAARRDVPIKRETPAFAVGPDSAGTGQFMRFKLTPAVQSNMAYPPMMVIPRAPPGQHQYQNMQPGLMTHGISHPFDHPSMMYVQPDSMQTPHIHGVNYGAHQHMQSVFTSDHDDTGLPDAKRRKTMGPVDDDDDDGPSAGTSGSNGDSDDELSPADLAALEAEFNNPAAGPDETDAELVQYTNINVAKAEQLQRERGTPGVPLMELPDGPARHQVKEFNILPITKLKLNYRPCNSHYIVINLLCDRRMRRPESVIFLMAISAKRMIDERSSDIEVENLKISKEMVQGRTKGFKFHLLFTLMSGPMPIACIRSEGFFLWSNISQAGFPRHQREKYLEERKQAKRTRRKRV